ncbi:MAG: hypothetical protein KAJ51_17395, partial [Thermoplasmata archaeon]|nr:hypothetical protein [Thermoplasmata archaeon]
FDKAHGGYLDIFVFKLNQNGSGPIYSTFIGGSGFESAYSIVITSNGNAIITGHTSSSTFPNTTGVFDQSYNGAGDAYVLELNQNGSKVIFSTFIGDTKPEAAFDIELDFNENIYLTGSTQSKNFPLTQDALDSSYDLLDGFAIKLNSNASVLLYSTFLGGNDTEYNQKVAVDLKGNMYLSGSTNSANFTNTTGAYDITHNGESDGYVTKLSFNKTLKIHSVKLFMNTVPTDIIYSRLCPYTFRVQIFDPSRVMHFGTVTLSLNPNGTNIQLHWNCSTGQFSKRNDYNNYVALDRSNSSYQYLSSIWIIDFNVIVNWTYPDENFHDVQAYANTTIISPVWLNVTGFYRVENDLIFKGALIVRGEDKRIITNGELVRGGEVLNWTGLIAIYENTTDIHPPDDEFNITIWDESGNYLEDSPAAGVSFNLETLTSPNTNIFGYYYKINLSIIPPECDATNEIFKIKIDGDNVTFSEPNPDNTTWQTTSDIKAGVTITDSGGGFVDGGSVMRAVSTDNGTIWDEWKVVFNLDTAKTIKAHDVTYFDDGTDNLIKWRALDTLGNGPAESGSYRILVDTQNVTFSNARPLVSNVSLVEKVEVGITIYDLTSGVNSSSVEYSISIDQGITWSYWE